MCLDSNKLIQGPQELPILSPHSLKTAAIFWIQIYLNVMLAADSNLYISGLQATSSAGWFLGVGFKISGVQTLKS